MQFRVLTIHAESSCSRGPGLTQTERPSPRLMMIAHCYRPDLCPSLCPRISAEPDPHLVSPVLLTHSQLCHLTGRGPTLPAASSHLNCLGEAWRLSSLCHCDKMRRTRRWRQTVLPVISAIKQVYPLKVLLRVQNMRRILKRSTFYNL